MQRLYVSLPPENPVIRKHFTKSERNRKIIERYSNGETLDEIAVDYGISNTRVHQIIQRWSED